MNECQIPQIKIEKIHRHKKRNAITILFFKEILRILMQQVVISKMH